jgi:hypothetical protein
VKRINYEWNFFAQFPLLNHEMLNDVLPTPWGTKMW